VVEIERVDPGQSLWESGQPLGWAVFSNPFRVFRVDKFSGTSALSPGRGSRLPGFLPSGFVMVAIAAELPKRNRSRPGTSFDLRESGKCFSLSSGERAAERAAFNPTDHDLPPELRCSQARSLRDRMFLILNALTQDRPSGNQANPGVGDETPLGFSSRSRSDRAALETRN
jgi:hypothetical protein